MNRSTSLLSMVALSAIPVFAHTLPVGQEPEPGSVEAAAPQEITLGNGRFVPAEGAQLMPWPRAYSGSLILVGVEDHGSWVEEGQPVARIDRSSLKRQIEDAELAVEAARFALESARMRFEMSKESAELSMHRAKMSVENAHWELESWHEFEREHREAQQHLSSMYREHGLEDAEDELNQLEAMYSDDELTDATEEIVLKRSRRNLDRSRFSAELQERQAAHNAEMEMERTSMLREIAVKEAELALEHAHRNHRLKMESEERGLQDAKRKLVRAEQRLEDLRNDAKQLSLVAPRRGMLLHGSMDQAGKTSAYQIGSSLAPRQIAFSIVDPGKLEIAMTLNDEQFAHARQGGQVVVECAALELKVMGKIEVDPFPTAGGYAARVHLKGDLPTVTPGTTASVTMLKEN